MRSLKVSPSWRPGWFLLSFAFSPSFQEEIKRIPGVAFDGRRKAWTAAADTLELVLKIAQGYGFEIERRAALSTKPDPNDLTLVLYPYQNMLHRCHQILFPRNPWKYSNG